MGRRTQKRIALLVGVPVVLGAGLLGAYVVNDVHRKNRMAESLREGTAAYEAADYRGTMDKLGYYVGQNRKDGKALLMIADARRKTPEENRRHILEAIPYAKAAAESLPNDPAPLEMLLELYGEANFLLERLKTAEALLKINPRHYDALKAKAIVLANTGKTAEAVETGLTLYREYPDDIEAAKDAVRLMVFHGTPEDEVEKFVSDAVEAHPDDSRFLVMQSQVAAHQGDPSAAIVLAKRAAELPVKSAAALGELLSLLDVLGNIDATLVPLGDRLLQREMQGPLAAEVATVAAERAWKLGQLASAQEAISKAYDASDLGKASDNALGWAAYLHVIESHSREAANVKPLVDELSRRTNSDAAFWLALIDAQVLLDQGKPQDARAKVNAAKNLRPDSDLAEFIEGDIDQRVGEWRLGVARWTRLARSQPTWRVIHIALVTLLLQRNEVAQAVKEAEIAAKVRPGNAELMLLARAYAALVESDQARQEQLERVQVFANDLSRMNDLDPELTALVARVCLGMGMTQDGERLVRGLLEKSPPPSPEVFASLAGPLRRTSPELSEQVMARARVEADTPELLYQAAVQYADAGQPEKGRELLERARENQKGSLDLNIRYAAYLDRIGDPRALEEFDRLAREYENAAAVQTTLLDSGCAWQDEKIVIAAIERLRRITGDGGSAWKAYESRRLMTFSPSQARAAQAVQLLAPVINTDPTNTLALALTAEAQLMLGDRDQAIELLRQAVQAEPSRPTFYPRLIELLQATGRSDEAAQRLLAFTKIVRLAPEVQRRRAQLLAAQGMWDLAAADYKVLADRGSAEDTFSYGAVLVRKGDTAGARRAMDAAAAMPDLSEPVVVGIADFYALQGDIELGRKLLEERLPASSAPHRSLVLALFFDRHRQYEEAEKHLLEQVKDGKAESLAELASFYLKQRRSSDAQAVVDRGLAAFPDNPRLRQIAGFIKLGTGGQNSAALADIVAAMDQSNTSEPMKMLAQAIQEYETDTTRVDAYLSRLEAITDKYPAFFPAWKMLVQARAQRGQMREAVDAARMAVKALPVDPRPTRLATEAMFASGMLEDALVMANAWRERAVDDPFEADMAVAGILSAMLRHQEAVERMERWTNRIIAEESTNPSYLEQLTLGLASVGRVSEAKNLLWPRLEKDEAWAPTCLRVAERLSPGEQELWFSKLEPALSKNPTHRVALGRAMYISATASNNPAMFDRAIEVLRPALEDPGARAAAALYSAGCYDARGNRNEAIRHYRMAIDKVPNDPASLNNLAYLLSSDPATVGEAVTLAQRAVEIAEKTVQAPNLRTSFLETLGVCHLRAGQAAEAEQAFRRATDLNPTALEAWLGLGEALVAQERLDDARPILQRIDAAASKPTGNEFPQRLEQLRARLSPNK